MDKNGTLSVSKSINNTNYRIRKIKRKIKNNYDEEEYGSLGPISGYGEYKLEKEENVNKSFFFCGL
jgi:hypothetical protein